MKKIIAIVLMIAAMTACLMPALRAQSNGSSLLSLDTPTAPHHGPYAFTLEAPEPPQAGTSNEPPTTQTFFQSVQAYFTSFDTNSTTFASNRAEVSIGTATINNQNMDVYLAISLNIVGSFSLRAEMRNTTALGDVDSLQAGLGYSLVKYDTKATFYVDAGDSFGQHRAFVAPGLEVKKALTPNTYAGVGLEMPVYFGHALPGSPATRAPTFKIFSGFVF